LTKLRSQIKSTKHTLRTNRSTLWNRSWLDCLHV